MPMLAAVTCLARRRRMHCRGSATAAALELDQGQHGPGDHRHRWRDERAEPPAHVGMPGREPAELPRAPLPHASRRQGRRRVPRDGGPPAPLGSRRPRQTVTAAGAELAPTQEEARSQPGPGSSSAAVALKKKAPDAAGRVARRAGELTASAPAPEAAPSPVLCAVCLEEVRRRRRRCRAPTRTTPAACCRGSPSAVPARAAGPPCRRRRTDPRSMGSWGMYIEASELLACR